MLWLGYHKLVVPVILELENVMSEACLYVYHICLIGLIVSNRLKTTAHLRSSTCVAGTQNYLCRIH